VRLFAHATQQSDINRARWFDWLSSVEDGFHILRGHCEKVFVVGLSLGGALSLLFGSRYPVDGIVACSAPYQVPNAYVPILRPILPALNLVWKYAPKAEADWANKEMAKDHIEYPAYPIRGAVELYDLLKELRQSLASITAPTLLIHSTQDQSVRPSHAERLFHHLGAEDKQMVWLEESGHVVTRDVERAKVFHEATDFIRRVSGENTP
jgi:carboxylesterase